MRVSMLQLCAGRGSGQSMRTPRVDASRHQRARAQAFPGRPTVAPSLAAGPGREGLAATRLDGGGEDRAGLVAMWTTDSNGDSQLFLSRRAGRRAEHSSGFAPIRVSHELI